ncbi:MAG: GIY-YIG nuclease family protein, partial [Aphanizomenon sp.]
MVSGQWSVVIGKFSPITHCPLPITHYLLRGILPATYLFHNTGKVCMTMEVGVSSLAGLEYYAYIDDYGEVMADFEGKIGVYAIFNQDKVLQFVGYSRDIYVSLKQHLVRRPQCCYWVKVQTIERPNRTVLEGIEDAWVMENGDISITETMFKQKWTNPIDVRDLMTLEEKNDYEYKAIDDVGKCKVLKNVERRVEEEIVAVLMERG